MADRQITLRPPVSPPTIAVAVGGRKKGKETVTWALEKFASEGSFNVKLFHVRPKITSVPTPMGNAIPITEVRDDVATAYRQEIEWHAKEMLQPFKKMCERRQVPAEVVVLEADDIAAAISDEIIRSQINRLVIGASSCSFFSRKKFNLCSAISASTQGFCTVYVVSKGKLSSIQPSNSDGNAITKDNVSEKTSSSSGSSEHNSSPNNESSDITSNPRDHLSRAQSLPVLAKRLQQPLVITRLASVPVKTSSLGSDETKDIKDMGSQNKSNGIDTPQIRQFEERKSAMSSSSSNSRASPQALNTSDALIEQSFTDKQVNLNFEIEKLRAELRNVQEMYAMAQTETMDASRKLTELNQCRSEAAMKLEELKLKEQEDQKLAEKEKHKFEEAKREAEKVRKMAEKETAQRKEAERKAARDAKEKDKLKSCIESPALKYQHFSWEEIVSATSSFSDNLRIGMGAYGTVYKCNLHHTTAAVKILRSAESGMSTQFQQELEILSKIRHPHLLLLLGACPEHGCLVYEYMENGSLEDRLFQINNTLPLPWFERFRIAWEVASALVFLHKSRPKSIIHRNLKPANILLDHNFVSKLGDVGLSTMVLTDPLCPKFSIWKQTCPVGTFCYIDPEYQRTGMISPKSDTYSFGVILLQLITARSAIGLTDVVEKAMESNTDFLEILDQKAGSWPIEETRGLAALALSCTELRKKDRPDLKDQVLPELEDLKKFADKARNSLSDGGLAPPPSHFICPLLKDVMDEPCVAADGYTYERRAIEEWLEQHGTSPMTNLPLSNNTVLPNYSLYTAIMDWRSRRR